MNEKSKNAFSFIQQIRVTPALELQTIIQNLAGEDLMNFFNDFSENLLAGSNPATLANNVRSLMLIGYLVRCNEENVPHSKLNEVKA